ncbi:MAG: nicotinamide phosphoribosyltransferase domain-containing protein, partial [Pseudomonadota bacterium]
MRNLILATDSYKQSHFRQYPPEARAISAYGEARPNPFSDEAVFLGLQPFLIDYLSRPISQADIEEAADICAAHGVPFNREGWQAILDDHGGFLPL